VLSGFNYISHSVVVFTAQRKKRKRTLDWDNENDRERMLQQQAIREMRHSTSAGNHQNDPKLKVEPKRDGESLKRFNKRVREETTKVSRPIRPIVDQVQFLPSFLQMLAEQVPRMTASAQRRKDKLKTIKLKKKGVVTPTEVSGHYDSVITAIFSVLYHSQENDAENIVFGSRSDGYIRPSDRDDSRDTFRRAESGHFGDTAETPPDLATWKDKLASKAKKLVRSAAAATIKKPNSVEVEKIRLQAIEAYKQVKEKRRKQQQLVTGNAGPE
jgi:hypothetical protein